MDDGIRSSGVEQLLVTLFPVCVFDFELDFRDGDDLLESEAGGIPEVYGQVIRGGRNKILVFEVLKIKDITLHISVPHEGLMVQSSGEQALVHGAPLAPIERVDALIVASELLFELVGVAIPKANVPSEAGTR